MPTEVLEAFGKVGASLKGIELPAAIILGLLILLAIIWVLRDTTAPKLAASLMPMATTLLTENTENQALVVDLMKEQGENKVRLIQLQNQVHQIEQRLEDAESSRRKLTAEIQNLEIKVKGLEDQLEEEQNQKMELLKLIADLQRQLDVKDDEIAKLKDQLVEIQAQSAPMVEGD